MGDDLNYDRIDHRAVRLAYRLLLGRDAESNERVESYLNASNIDEIREIFLRSSEFKNQTYFRDRATESENFCSNYESLRLEPVPINGNTKVRILQTSDAEKYSSLLMESSKSSIAYVKRWSMEYQMHVGLKMGSRPHHATLNRIFLLKELIDTGYQGWILYLDADAVICDHMFDVRSYLSDRSNTALICARAESSEDCPYWNVNAGVFFANLNHEVCRFIIIKWAEFYQKRYSSFDFDGAVHWNDVLNDQTSLHGILRIPCFEKYVDSNPSNTRIFNGGSSFFIRQFMRNDHTQADDESFATRLTRLKDAVEAALASIEQAE